MVNMLEGASHQLNKTGWREGSGAQLQIQTSWRSLLWELWYDARQNHWKHWGGQRRYETLTSSWSGPLDLCVVGCRVRRWSSWSYCRGLTRMDTQSKWRSYFLHLTTQKTIKTNSRSSFEAALCSVFTFTHEPEWNTAVILTEYSNIAFTPAGRHKKDLRYRSGVKLITPGEALGGIHSSGSTSKGDVNTHLRAQRGVQRSHTLGMCLHAHLQSSSRPHCFN